MKILLLLMLVSIPFLSVNAAVKTWDGGGADTNLQTAANWVGDIAPVAGDDLVFPSTIPTATLGNNFATGTSFRSLTFEGGAYTLNGNALSLTNGINVTSGVQTIGISVSFSAPQSITCANINASAIIAAASLGSNTLTIEGNGQTGLGLVLGSGNIIKNGNGQALVAAVFFYSGDVTVNGGIFVFDATNTSTDITVNTNGALGGTGRIGLATVNSLGAISAGTLNSPTGIFNTGNLSVAPTGIVAIKIGGVAPGANGYDQLNVSGSVSIAGAQLAPIAWNGFRPAVGDSFTIINNDGSDAISGVFNNLPEGARIGALGIAFRVSYIGGSGNDAVISRVNLSPYDFDADGKSDVSAFTGATGIWRIRQSGNAQITTQQFGANGDKVVPVDFDGDTKADIAVFRPSNGSWYYLRSTDNTFFGTQFGANGDIPVPNDFDGDGRADIAVYRPSDGAWYQIRSLSGQFFGQQFGIAEDKPQMGDYDGDGMGDLAVFRPSNGVWYVWLSSTSNFTGFQFGIPTDVPVPADYDGDGKTDYAVWRPSSADGVPDFYVSRSSDAAVQGAAWGNPGDIPVIGDYDGDGKADFSVFRPSANGWYLLQSTAGFGSFTFGSAGDIPVPSAFNQ